MERIEDFTEREFAERLGSLSRLLIARPAIAPSTEPKAVLLGGQSGAGKTTLHNIFGAKFKENVVVVNGDEYRSAHPRFAAINARYGIEAPAHTAAWASRMVESLVDRLSSARYNLIVEGTLRTAQAPLKTASLLRDKGYGVSLAVMAVKPEISLISCQLRWEQMRLAGTTPRAVDPAHHRVIVENIVDNLTVLEESGAFDGIELYSRTGACLFSNDLADQATGGSAGDALRDILFGPWTSEEKDHFLYLGELLERLKSL